MHIRIYIDLNTNLISNYNESTAIRLYQLICHYVAAVIYCLLFQLLSAQEGDYAQQMSRLHGCVQ